MEIGKVVDGVDSGELVKFAHARVRQDRPPDIHLVGDVGRDPPYFHWA